jgi:hypothetical protein
MTDSTRAYSRRRVATFMSGGRKSEEDRQLSEPSGCRDNRRKPSGAMLRAARQEQVAGSVIKSKLRRWVTSSISA